MRWIKKCKVCENVIDPKNLGEHNDCKEYAKIVRYEKQDD